MSAYTVLSKILRGGDDNRIYFECPGCGVPHGLAVGEGDGPRWGWDGNVDAPTFTPSVLVNFTYAGKPAVCHSFVTGGRIQFLGDCTHELAFQTVDIPDWDTVC